MKKRCRGLHEILLVAETNALGVVVSCLSCSDTFQAEEEYLEENYYHFHHVSPEGPAGDMDLFILDKTID